MAITLATASAAVAGAASGYLAPLRATMGMAGFPADTLADAALLPSGVAAGLFACGIVPGDPTSPADADVASLAPADWPKFLAFADLSILEKAAAVAALLPKSLTYANSDFKVDFEPKSLADLLAARRKAVATLYPDGAIGTTEMRAAWMTVSEPRRPPGSRRGPDGPEF